MKKVVILLTAIMVAALLTVSSASAKPKYRHKRVKHQVTTEQTFEQKVTRPSGCPSLWCGCWLSLDIFNENRKDLWKALAWLKFPRTDAHPGAVAVLRRKGGGHVGKVISIDNAGNPTIISGNHNKRVATATYPKHRVVAYVMPR